jgi:hypothetical protein
VANDPAPAPGAAPIRCASYELVRYWPIAVAQQAPIVAFNSINGSALIYRPPRSDPIARVDPHSPVPWLGPGPEPQD